MLTNTQLQILANDILLDPVLSSLPLTPDSAFAIAEAYNQESNPTYVVWKTAVGIDEIMNNGFVWTAVDGLTNGKARIWEWMTRLGTINPSKANIRQGLQDAFGAGSAMSNAIAPHLKRSASRVERLFATGTGTTQSPGTLVFEGRITYQDIQEARDQ